MSPPCNHALILPCVRTTQAATISFGFAHRKRSADRDGRQRPRCDPREPMWPRHWKEDDRHRRRHRSAPPSARGAAPAPAERRSVSRRRLRYSRESSGQRAAKATNPTCWRRRSRSAEWPSTRPRSGAIYDGTAGVAASRRVRLRAGAAAARHNLRPRGATDAAVDRPPRGDNHYPTAAGPRGTGLGGAGQVPAGSATNRRRPEGRAT